MCVCVTCAQPREKMMRSYVVVHGKTENDSGLGSHVCVCVCVICMYMHN